MKTYFVIKLDGGVVKVNAQWWEVQNNEILVFMDEQKHNLAIFNFKNIVGVKEYVEGE